MRVMIACSGTATFSQSTGVAPTVSVIQQPIPSADLYLCSTTNNATDPPQEGDNDGVQKASIEILEDHYKELHSRKIQDSLSSFLPDIPGEFNAIDSTETKLRNLLDQRVIGNKEFHLLSGHALLGFRLLPGPLPEQYRMDPPVHETRSHHRKKKHKHRSIEKVGEEGIDLNPPSVKVKMPGDVFGFVKSESPSILHSTPSPSTHIYTSPVERNLSVPIQKVVASGGHIYSPAMTASPAIGTNAVVAVGHDTFPGGKKKKEKRKNKEKKKERKEKKKKKDKHHSQDLPVGPPGPSQPAPHPPTTYSLQ